MPLCPLPRGAVLLRSKDMRFFAVERAVACMIPCVRAREIKEPTIDVDVFAEELASVLQFCSAHCCTAEPEEARAFDARLANGSVMCITRLSRLLEAARSLELDDLFHLCCRGIACAFAAAPPFGPSCVVKLNG